MFNKSQSTSQFRLPLASTTSRSAFKTRLTSPKLTKSFRPKETIECIEIRNNFPSRDLFFELQRVWKENDIPEIHQKYFYFILTSNLASQEYLMHQEIQSYKVCDSIIKTLHRLTISREICLNEALKEEQSENIIEYVCLMSNYLYDLRKITLNLVEYHRKWVNKLYIQYPYNYQFIYQGENYMLKIKNDHKSLFQKSPVLSKFFHISENVDDVFYLGIINQAYERDLEYFDYLTKHKLDQKYMKRIKELQTYLTVQFSCQQSENKTKTLLMMTRNNMLSGNNLQSGAATSRKASVNKLKLDLPPLPEYRSEMIYKSDEVNFYVKEWPIKEIPQILSYWLSYNFEDFHKSFLQPATYIQETLSYGQEAMMLQISDLGIMLASVEQDCKFRKWVIHLIVCKEQIFDKIIHHFLQLLINKGDSFQQLGINLTLLECFEYNLKILNFYFSKIITIENLKVNYTQYVFDVKRTEQQQHSVQVIYDPICFIYARTLSRVKKLVLNSDEETMEAQMCANLGKLQLIQFNQQTQDLSKNLMKQKICGQSFLHIQNVADVRKHCSRFKSSIKSAVYLQQFNLNLQFLAFTSEVHKQTHCPYLRFPSRPNCNIEDAPLLQLQSNDPLNLRKIYLIATADPSIKLYIFELKYDEVTLDISKLIAQLFESYDQKNHSEFNLWLPFFSCVGNRQTLKNVQLHSYFTSETFFQVLFPRIGLTSVNHSFEGEKILSYPFIIGIVQSDLEIINKPVFSLLVEEEHIIKKCEPTLVARKQNKDSEIVVMQINPKDIDLRVKEIIRFSSQATLHSFECDANKLITIMRYQQEACVIQYFLENLVEGYSILYVDQNKVHERVWIIELISCQTEIYFDIFLTGIIDLVFEFDKSASEIIIAQTHHKEDNGQLIVNKFIQESIKKSGFKWRIVENDSKTQTRKTVYSMKRTKNFAPKIEHSIALRFESYYSLQQSEARNEETNSLIYFKNRNYFQYAEDCFHYKMHKPYEQNQYIVEKIKNNLAQIPMTEFFEFQTEAELQKCFINLTAFPELDPKHNQIMTQLTNLQLKWLRSREIFIEGTKYIEIPNDSNFIYVSNFPKMNRRIYFVRLFDPAYYFFAMEIAYNQIEAVRNEYVRFGDTIIQEFHNKQPQTSSDLFIPQFKSCMTLSEPKPNWCQVNFSVCFNHTIQQTILKDLGNRTIKLQMPIYTGVIQEDVGLKFKFPIMAYIASEYVD